MSCDASNCRSSVQPITPEGARTREDVVVRRADVEALGGMSRAIDRYLGDAVNRVSDRAADRRALNDLIARLNRLAETIHP